MSDEDSKQTVNNTRANLDSYRPTPYEDNAWPVVGEFINQDYFQPMQFRAVQVEVAPVDPMFANYGGLDDSGSDVRAHVGPGQRFVPTKKRNAQEQQAEVEALKRQQEHELEQVAAEARDQAYQEGVAAGKAEAEEQYKALENRYAEVLRDISSQLNESLDGIENQAVTLAVAISEKLVGTIVEVNPEYILDIVRDALRLSASAQIKTVRVAPQDLEFFELLKLTKEFKEYDGSWKFQADETIKAGCIVETSAGQVDYDLDKAWQRIAEQVVKVR